MTHNCPEGPYRQQYENAGGDPFAPQPYAEPAYDPYPYPHPQEHAHPVTATAIAPAPEPVAAPKAPGRDRYLDLLRATALIRVVLFHTVGWAWLTVVFPSMGVMFALAGSLMARSLSRPAAGVIRDRIRRLLPPLWVFGAMMLGFMFYAGWRASAEDGLWWWLKILNYLVPVGAPPFPWAVGTDTDLLGTGWAVSAIVPLWYLRTYLWFVVASPLLLMAFRRSPWLTMLAPIALTAVIETGLVTIPGETGSAVSAFAQFGACWILGFAHQDGLLKKIPRYIVVSSAAMVMAFGLWWASGHLTEEGWNLNAIPLAQATWSLGFTTILLTYSPSWQRLPGRLARFDKLVTLFNNRAITIYLWHNILILLAVPLIDLLWKIPFVSDNFAEMLGNSYQFLTFVLVWPLLALMILAVGWVEDVAGRRSPRLWPNGKARSKVAQRSEATG
ncbi:acyltransferase [Streptomyces sp. ISL-96]|uniref:acyltransferase family protein n=1 Tax=Streptomyces sp. ISL-96 TaxID=2819191 RepID=UPI001BEA02D1|nr:acyltransferase [Streptomyces sp. ISL-96]MBT2491207.1 acyltransferase [Streptomyces sp. ISL-96]